MNARPVFAACVLAALSANALVAQAKQWPVRPWMVSISGGVAVGNSGHGVEQAMRAAGFDDEDCFLDCYAPRPPRSYAGGFSGSLTVRRSIRPHLQVVALVGTWSLRETFGFMADTGSLAAFGPGSVILLRQSVRMAAVLAGIGHRSGAMWLAAGPAVFQPRLRVTHPLGADQSQLRVGSTLAGGITTLRRFFVEAQAQYRLVGHMDLEPIAVETPPGFPPAALPRTSVNFNHYTMQLGAGVRW